MNIVVYPCDHQGKVLGTVVLHSFDELREYYFKMHRNDDLITLTDEGKRMATELSGRPEVGSREQGKRGGGAGGGVSASQPRATAPAPSPTKPSFSRNPRRG